jgi:hypothetical protein
MAGLAVKTLLDSSQPPAQVPQHDRDPSREWDSGGSFFTRGCWAIPVNGDAPVGVPKRQSLAISSYNRIPGNSSEKTGEKVKIFFPETFLGTQAQSGNAR